MFKSYQIELHLKRGTISKDHLLKLLETLNNNGELPNEINLKGYYLYETTTSYNQDGFNYFMSLNITRDGLFMNSDNNYLLLKIEPFFEALNIKGIGEINIDKLSKEILIFVRSIFLSNYAFYIVITKSITYCRVKSQFQHTK